MKDGTLESRLARVLFSYCTIPHSTTGQTSAELLLGRLPKPVWTNCFLTPHYKWNTNSHSRRGIMTGWPGITTSEWETVQVRNFLAGDSWIVGEIVKTVGPVSFIIQLKDGHCIKWHHNHFRSRLIENKNSPQDSASSEERKTIEAFLVEDTQNTEATRTEPAPAVPFECY